MKKICYILMTVVILLAMFSSPAIAASTESNSGCTVHLHEQEEIALLAALPSCPNGSSHSGWKIEKIDNQKHKVRCNTCDRILIHEQNHIWSVSAATCTEEKKCALCKFVIEGALGHDVYPTEEGVFVPIETSVTDGRHGKICLREDCIYNPDHEEYGFYEGYIPGTDDPHVYYGDHYYTTYWNVNENCYYHVRHR